MRYRPASIVPGRKRDRSVEPDEAPGTKPAPGLAGAPCRWLRVGAEVAETALPQAPQKRWLLGTSIPQDAQLAMGPILMIAGV